jgi:uncharacterized protein YbaR (Trm112 family)
MAVDPELLEILACPHCKTPVVLVKNDARSSATRASVYPIKDDIPVMLIDGRRSNRDWVLGGLVIG